MVKKKQKRSSKPLSAMFRPQFMKKSLRMACEPVLMPVTIATSGTFLYPLQVSKFGYNIIYKITNCSILGLILFYVKSNLMGISYDSTGTRTNLDTYCLPVHVYNALSSSGFSCYLF